MKIQLWPNIASRSYHTRVKVTTKTYVSSSLDATDELIKLFDEIPGVLETAFHKYQVDIKKSPVFEWEEIDVQVLALMNKLGLIAPDDKAIQYIWFDKVVPKDFNVDAENERMREEARSDKEKYGF